MTPIIAIDPGTEQSAVLVWDGTVVQADIIPNPALLEIARTPRSERRAVYCEMIASYGMPVGKEIFETCVFIGQLKEAYEANGSLFHLVYRRDIKLHHCLSPRATDANIRQALIDKYGKPGTRKEPGLLYGIHSHLWSALAIATYVTEREAKAVEYASPPF